MESGGIWTDLSPSIFEEEIIFYLSIQIYNAFRCGIWTDLSRGLKGPDVWECGEICTEIRNIGNT